MEVGEAEMLMRFDSTYGIARMYTLLSQQQQLLHGTQQKAVMLLLPALLCLPLPSS
jgi:hypothetical protein